MKFDCLIDNVNILQEGPTGPGLVQSQSVAISGHCIGWVGPIAEAGNVDVTERLDGEGRLLTPGLIDCHTHLVYGGDRADEFARRLRGVPYEEIARSGGGILSTVTATRSASEEELLDASMSRLQALAGEGVTTVEIKSGYGLELESELKMLRVARRLGELSGVEVVTTLLAAHALPPEYKDNPAAYIDLVCNEILPAAADANLADAVDVFCENIAFNLAECQQVFECAAALGLPVKGHVEQLSYMGGARLVAEYDGLSVDHIEYLEETDLGFLQRAGTVAVLLPGAFYTLGETRKPPVQALREASVPMAVASDLNPGSSPMASLLLNLNMASVLFGLTAEENLMGVTSHAAAALGLTGRKGRIEEGFDADLVLWNCTDHAALSYGHRLVKPEVVWRGGSRT